MKILVVEHGTEEDRCIGELAKDPDIELIKIGYPRLNRSADTFRHEKIEFSQLNATDSDAVAEAAAGMDFVVDMTAPWMASYIKKGALQANASYVNPKSDALFWHKFIEGKRRLQNSPSIVSPEMKKMKYRKAHLIDSK